MTLRFTCPNKPCSKIWQVDDIHGGKDWNCPTCKTPIKIPIPPPPVISAQEDEHESDDTSEDANNALIILWVAFGGSCALAIAGLFVWIGLTFIALPVAIVLLVLALVKRNRMIENDLITRANEGDAQAQYDLACRRRSKRKFDGDDGAVYWYKEAAEREHVLAQFTLGLLFKNGFGAEKNPVQAVHWFEKAANHGLADAQYELGLCYFWGYGIKEDEIDIKAFYWLEKAAINGSKNARAFKSLADVQYKMALAYQTGKERRKDPIRAIVLLKKAAEQGLAEAQYELGRACQTGTGIAQDIAQATRWFENAANQNHAEAQYELGLCYLKGNGVEEDRNRAIYWCKKAVENGSTNAEAIVGFKKIEKLADKFGDNYQVIKKCCIELAVKGYKLSRYYISEPYPSTHEASISVDDASGSYIGSIEFATFRYDSGAYHSHNHWKAMTHIEHFGRRIFHHIIQLDGAGIIIESKTPSSEAPPEWMIICAIILARNYPISYPDWVQPDCREATSYVNVAFQLLEHV